MASASTSPRQLVARLATRAIVLPLVLTGLLAAVMLAQVLYLLDTARWVLHTDQVIAQAEQVEGLLVDIQSGVRGFLLAGDPAFLAPYERARPRLEPALEDLTSLVEDNPAQVARAQELHALSRDWARFAGQTVALARSGAGEARTGARLARGKELMDALRGRVADFVGVETTLRAQRTARSQRATSAVAGSTLGLTLLLGATIAGLSRRQLTRVAEGYEQAHALTQRQASELRQLAAELEARVEARTQQLQVANEELEAFSYSVSHDLRAPLRAIDGFSKVLLERYAPALDAQGQHYLTRIRAGSQRMGQLIDDLLRLSRISRAELSVRPVDLAALAREVVAELRAREPERRVEVSLPASLPAVGDAHLLRIALENLLGNAWKFTGRRPDARIALDVRREEGRTVYEVRDNGAGFDMAYAGKLFSPFQRLHHASEFEGSGIGLATVQRVVRRHGGQVWAESAVGQGTTVSFCLGGTQA